MAYFVYILASGRNGTLYAGVTNDLKRRVYEHKTKTSDGFTKKYNITSLVYFETFSDPSTAIEWEKRLKRFRRGLKIELIEKVNYEWKDLYAEL